MIVCDLVWIDLRHNTLLFIQAYIYVTKSHAINQICSNYQKAIRISYTLIFSWEEKRSIIQGQNLQEVLNSSADLFPPCLLSLSFIQAYIHDTKSHAINQISSNYQKQSHLIHLHICLEKEKRQNSRAKLARSFELICWFIPSMLIVYPCRVTPSHVCHMLEALPQSNLLISQKWIVNKTLKRWNKQFFDVFKGNLSLK